MTARYLNSDESEDFVSSLPAAFNAKRVDSEGREIMPGYYEAPSPNETPSGTAARWARIYRQRANNETGDLRKQMIEQAEWYEKQVRRE